MKKTAQFMVIFAIFVGLTDSVFGQTTAFTYQGVLNDAGNPANGLYDLRFSIFDTVTNGSVVGNPLTNSATPVSNGLFTVSLDFGPGVFTGPDRWLRIAVRTNGANNFSAVTPRQPLTPAPYAIFAANANAAGLIGTIPTGDIGGTYGNGVSFTNGNNNFTGRFSGSGAGLTNVWLTVGNVGTVPGPNFVGTADNRSLELHVNGQRGLRLDPDSTTNISPNFIAGSPLNSVAGGVVGAAIGGGGTASYLGLSGVNQVLGSFNTIGGGVGNTTGSTNFNTFQATVAGGALNTASGISSTIAGGARNLAYNNDAAIAGGFQNRAAYRAAVAGGDSNTADGSWGGIGGGYNNNIQTNAQFAVIGGGLDNIISGTNGEYGSTIGGGYVNSILIGSSASTIAGGVGNSIGPGASGAFIGGGTANTNTFGGAMIGAGFYNQANNFDTVVAGGAFNVNAGYRSFIGSGQNNVISNVAAYAMIPGGYQNIASGNTSFAAGQDAKAIHNGAFVWADSQGFPLTSTANNQFLIRAGGGVGIGTSTPGAQLDVAGGNGTAVRLTGPGGGGAMLSYDFATYYPGTNAPAARILATDDGSWSAGLDILTKAPGAEPNLLQSRMHISSSGYVGLGLTSPAYQLELSTNSAAKPGGGSWANSSDVRLKTKIQTMPDALDRLLQLRGVTFEWVHPQDHANQTGPQGGFIAQEVAAIFPSWVTEVPAAGEDRQLTTNGKIKSLSLPFEFDALIVEAIKTQQQQIQSKDSELASLRRELAAQKQLNRLTEARLQAIEQKLAGLGDKPIAASGLPN